MDIIEELKDDARKMHFIDSVKRKWVYVVTPLLMLLIVYAGYSYLSYRKAQESRDASQEFYSLYFSSISDVAKFKDLSSKGNSVYSNIAAFLTADTLLGQDRYNEAAATLLDTVKNTKDPKSKNVTWIRILSIANKYKIQDLKLKAIPVFQDAVSKSEPLSGVMGIMLADSLLNLGDQQKARSVLKQVILAKNSVESVKSFARVMLGAI